MGEEQIEGRGKGEGERSGEERGDMFGHVSAGRRMGKREGELENTRRVCHANAPLLAARSTPHSLVNAWEQKDSRI